MAEISKITDYIISKAENDAKDTINIANEQYDARLAQAENMAQSEAEDIINKANEESKRIHNMAQSAAKQEQLKKLLSLKNTAISTVIDSAKNIVYNLDDNKYMELISKFILKYSTGKEGTVLFNSKDKSRLNDDVKKVISKCGLTVDENDAKIDGGFILKYGYIEENCSIEAMFKEREEEFTDYISENLFK